METATVFCATLVFMRRIALLLSCCMSFLLHAQISHGQATAPTGRTVLDRKIDSVIRRVRIMPRSQQAIEVLENLMAVGQQENVSQEQNARILDELKKFREYRDKNLVRHGTTWIDDAEARRREAEADQEIELGVGFLKAQNYNEARDCFLRASATDRSGVRADFILGILNTPLSPQKAADPIEWKAFFAKAEDHFKQARSRSPSPGAHLNNLALVHLRQGDLKEAIKLWKELNSLEPDSPIVLHNVTELIEQMKLGRISLGKTEVTNIQRFFAELNLGGDPQLRPAHSRGWWYDNLTLSHEEESRTRFDDTAVDVEAHTGSGFVVHPGYLLTAAHLVADANSVRVEFRGGRTSDAKILVVSSINDVALLKLEDGRVPALGSSAMMPVGSVTQFGYPTVRFGKPKAQKRVIQPSLLPNTSQYAELAQFQGVSNPGYCGGPICDSFGNVIGVATTLGTQDKGLTPVVPMSAAISFVESHVPEFKVMRKTLKVKLSESEIESAVSPSVGLVRVTKRYHNFGFGKAAQPTHAVDLLPSCCIGTGLVECDTKGCRKGTVSVRVTRKIGVNPVTGKDMVSTKNEEQECQRCQGTGLIRCPFGPSNH